MYGSHNKRSKIMRKLFVSSALVLGLMGSSVAFAEKYAVVDVQKAATDTTYMKSQMASLESSLKPQQQKHERLTKELTTLRNKAQNDAKVMKQADLQKLEQDYATKMNEFNANAD
jgi:outer membrane protein